MFYYFSRGYRIKVADHISEGTAQDSMVESGEPSVNALARRKLERKFNPMVWSDVAAVIDQAILLFDGIKNWITDQLRSNTRVFGHRAEYLIDSVGYILNGRRYMSNESWMLLLSGMDDGATMKTPLGSSVDQLLARLESIDDDELIQRWVAHPEGVVDLVDTLFTFFGYHIQSDMKVPVA